MNAFTVAELARLRSQPQHFRRKLAVFIPKAVWTGTLNGAHSKGAMILTVTTSSGSIASILADTVFLVGSGINQERVRIRSASGSTIYVSENSIDWDAGEALQALLYWEPMPIYNRIVNASGVITYYEDYNTAYVDQNENFDPVVNIGPAAYVLEKDCSISGSFGELEIDASEESFVFDSALSSYAWSVLRPADYTNPPTLTQVGAVGTFRFYDTGDYIISCTITAANGKSYTGYRPVMVRCEDDGVAGSPYFDFEVELEASRDTGYWTAKISVFEDCDLSEFPRNVPIIIYGDVAYGKGASRSTEPVPWHYSNTAHQRFVGWVKEEAWVDEYMDKGKAITFEAVGLCGVMEELRNYPAWLQYEAAPNEWIDMAGLSVDRMVYYYLHNRSNILRLTDWHKTGDTKLMHYAELPDGPMFSSLREFLQGTIFAEMVSDRCSVLWSELDGQMLQDAARASVVTNVHTVDTADHMNEIVIPTTRDRPECSWLTIDGLSFDGAVDTPMIAYAPGYVKRAGGGDAEEISGLVTPVAQADLNTLAGRLFALRNNPFKDIEYQSQGVYPYDIAPQGSLRYSGLDSGTFREETILDMDLLIRSVSDEFTEDLGLTCQLGLETIIRDRTALVGPNVPQAGDGVVGMFPPDIEGVDPGDYGTNWDDWPDWADFDFGLSWGADLGGGFSLFSGTTRIAVFNTDKYVYVTFNFEDETPTWVRYNLNWNGALLQIEVDPFSSYYLGTGNTVRCWILTTTNIYVVTFTDGVPGALTNQRTFPETSIYRAMHASFGIQNWAIVSTHYSDTAPRIGTWVEYTTNGGTTWTEKQINANYTGVVGGWWPGIFVSHKQPGLAWTSAFLGVAEWALGGMFRTTDYGATWTQITPDPRYCLCTSIEIPYPDNPNDQIILYGGNTGKTGALGNMFLYRWNGAGSVDISPTADTPIYGANTKFGPSLDRWRLYACLVDSSRLVMLGQARETIVTLDYYGGAFKSRDGGATWESMHTPLYRGTLYHLIGISGDNPDVGYIMYTGNCEVIGYTDDFYDTIQDKRGNIPTDFPGALQFDWLIGV